MRMSGTESTAGHTARGACVMDYGDAALEYASLCQAAGVLDLSARGRLCVLGADHVAFLHGQVTNDVKGLEAGQGCYTALTDNKGRMQADFHVWRLAGELLLDTEPGLGTVVAARLEQFTVAADVQVADAAPHFGLVSVQGPAAAEVLRACGLPTPALLRSEAHEHARWGGLYVMGHARTGTAGFDVFVPVATLEEVRDTLTGAASSAGGGPCGWSALELARIEAGIPRFGADMDGATLPPEAGIETRAVSFRKGCYVGQEVLNRIQSRGHVNRRLCRLQVEGGAPPVPGDRLHLEGRDLGWITSAATIPGKGVLALGYVARAHVTPGAALRVGQSSEAVAAVLGVA